MLVAVFGGEECDSSGYIINQYRLVTILIYINIYASSYIIYILDIHSNSIVL